MDRRSIRLCSAVVFLFAALTGRYALADSPPAPGSVALKTQDPFPAPTGPYAVGRTEFIWTDKSRADPKNPSGYRELAVWVWYPASPKPGAEPAQWMPGKWGDLFWSKAKEVAKHPEMAGKENPIGLIRAHSIADAPLSSEKKTYPVLLFEPGNTHVPLVDAAVTENIASHGYIVVAVTPTYYTTFTVLANGLAVVEQNPLGPDSYPVWMADMVFALNQVEKLNSDANSPFADRLDLGRVGAFGHSFGGAVSMEVLKEEPRVRAAIDLDGVMSQDATAADVSETGVHKPLLIFRHRTSAADGATDQYQRKTLQYGLVMRSGNPGYLLTFDRSVHENFTDLELLGRDLGIATDAPPTGLIDPTRALAIANAYVVAFFDRYLQGKKSPLLDGPSPEYPEVTFETNK